MTFPTSAVSVLCFLLVVNSAVALVVPYGFKEVKKPEDLWRFQVGRTGEKHGVTPGDDYICLRDTNGHFVQASSGAVTHDATDCDDGGRFTVHILVNEKFYLKPLDEKFLGCNDFKFALDTIGRSQTEFTLYVSPIEDELILVNGVDEKVVSAGGDPYGLTCSIFDLLPSYTSRFRGWKAGPKDAWKMTDKWVRVGKFDNRKSSSTGTFTYSKSVGTERVEGTALGAGFFAKAEAGASFSKFFSANVDTTIDVDWSKEPAAIWSTPTTTEDSIQVPPGVVTAVYQAVGTYGVFIVKSNYIRLEDIDSEGNVLHYQRPLLGVT